MNFCEYLFNFCCCCCYCYSSDNEDGDKYKIMRSSKESFGKPIYIHDIYENDLLHN